MRRLMNFIRRLGRFRPPRWVWLVAAAIATAALIWFVGPLISIAKWTPLGGRLSRGLLLLALALAAGGYYGWRAFRRRKQNAEMMASLADAPAPEPDVSAEDIAAMDERARRALELLRTTRLGKDKEYVYELPWYLIIGPPGAGKTTALHNAGLKFPVAQEVGAAPLRGVGGTRTCEWWFTDHAVLIDTAGRYTTQDSHAEGDAKAWQGFLNLLSKYRPRQPVTGLIVALSANDLISADEREVAAHGRAVRARINEVAEKLGVRAPVYLVITKMDLLAGFTEFFDDAGQREREQVWGHTFDADVSRAGGTSAGFEAAFEALTERLNARLLTRVQAERDVQRRALIFGFPQQFHGLRPALASLVQILARETKFEPTPLFRGVYFTSAAQFGRPVDRLMGSIAAKFGVDPVIGGGEPGQGRSYFLRDLLQEVVFKEAALADRDPKAEARRRWIRQGVAAAAAAVVVALAGVWALNYLHTTSLLHKLDEQSRHLAQTAASLQQGDISDSDLTQVLPVLNEARALPFASTAPKSLQASRFGMGLARRHAMQVQVDAAYTNLLNRQLLPRVVLSLEDQLRAALQAQSSGGSDQRARVYNLLRMYLMLGRAPDAPLERSQISSWFAADLADRFAGAEDDPTREALQAHMDTLLARPISAPKLDRDLIDRARQDVKGLTSGERAYARLLSEPSIAQLPQFTLAGVPIVGESGLFARKSGKSLSLGVPGLYRRQIFFSTVMPAIAKAAAQSANENWVTGEPAPKGAAPIASEAGRIKDEMLIAYLQDFTRVWDDFIGDITISGQRPPGERIRIATRPPSPVKLLIRALASETDLTPPKLTTKSSGGGAAAVRVASIFSSRIYRGAQRANAVGYAIDGGAQNRRAGPLDDVIEHFKWLQDATPAEGPSPLDDALQALAALGDASIAAQAASGLGDPLLQRTKASSAMEATARLDQSSATLPPALHDMFNGFVNASTSQLNRSVKQTIQQTYANELLPQCRSITEQGFPFKAGERQSTIDDLSRLLRPAGLLDQFVQANLSGLVDTSTNNWSLTSAGRALGLQSAAVSQFERADRIRRRMFMPGDVRPNVRFIVEPIFMDPKVTSAALTIDGAVAVFDAGQRRGVEAKWPGPAPGTTLSLQRSGGAPATRTWPGDFGLFQMVRSGRVTASSPRSLTVQLEIDGLSAGFVFRFQNTGNPFLFNDLASLTCPARL